MGVEVPLRWPDIALDNRPWNNKSLNTYVPMALLESTRDWIERLAVTVGHCHISPRPRVELLKGTNN